MTQYAIVHKATRVVRGVTTDSGLEVGGADELVALPAPVDLAGGPWKLRPNGSLVPASPQEADDGLPERRAERLRQQQNAALDAIIADQTAPQTVRQYFALLKAAKS